jgi:hypothetical protein
MQMRAPGMTKKTVVFFLPYCISWCVETQSLLLAVENVTIGMDCDCLSTICDLNFWIADRGQEFWNNLAASNAKCLNNI